MGWAVTIIAGIIFGFFAGIVIAIIIIFIKTKWSTWRVLKKNPHISEEIELNKKDYENVKKERSKETTAQRRFRLGSGSPSVTSEERGVKESDKPVADKGSPSERFGVSVSTPDFTLRE